MKVRCDPKFDTLFPETVGGDRLWTVPTEPNGTLVCFWMDGKHAWVFFNTFYGVTFGWDPCGQYGPSLPAFKSSWLSADPSSTLEA
jgi:hypothetical protein